jgi:hypothetical protein
MTKHDIVTMTPTYHYGRFTLTKNINGLYFLVYKKSSVTDEQKMDLSPKEVGELLDMLEAVNTIRDFRNERT